jgi:hypothetical protein
MKWKAYPGPELPKEKIATIKIEQRLFTGIGILKVDGKKPDKIRVEDIIEVLPGEHTLEVTLRSIPGGLLSPTYKRIITFKAEAGHVYIVSGMKKKWGGKKIWFWIKDMETNEVLDGRKPPE